MLKTFMKTLGSATALTIIALSSLPSQAEVIARSSATLTTADGKQAGTVNLQQTPAGVLITADLMNLTPGWHGFHLHETGLCEGDFTSAGDHFNPAGKEHGFLNPNGPHAGDMPNIYVNENGKAEFSTINNQVSLAEGEASLADGDGTAIIVHENPDSHQQDAGAGARQACGVMQMN
jgi:superoxide dismutase, Cu-Zn family